MHFFILVILLVFPISQSWAAKTHYPAGEEPVELSPHNPLNVQLPRLVYSQEDKKTEAMSLYLALMHEDAHNVWAPFQLAASLAEKGQTELAERYLQLSAKRGLWYYYNLLEGNAFTSIQQSDTYRSILAETKVRYQQHASQFEGKFQYAVPPGPAPAGGWPTVIYLHPYGKAAVINPEDRLLFAQAKVAYIALNGTQMLAEDSFRWSNYNAESTQSAIQRALQQLTPLLKLDPHQVFLTARGQGALHAANLMAKYPQFYAGALLIAPKGEIPPAQHSLAENKRIMIAYYDRQGADDRALALHFANLFNARNQVKTGQFAQNEEAIGGWQMRFNRPLRWLMGNSLDASPGA